jgi:hypothetical protein
MGIDVNMLIHPGKHRLQGLLHTFRGIMVRADREIAAIIPENRVISSHCETQVESCSFRGFHITTA